MSNSYVKLIKRLKDKDKKEVTIPELDLTLTIGDYMLFSYMILDFVKTGSLGNIKLREKKIEKKVVKSAMLYIKEKEKNNIVTILIYGKRKNEAYDLFKTKYSNDLVENKLIQPVFTDDYIVFHCVDGDELSERLIALSSIHLTVLKFKYRSLNEITEVYKYNTHIKTSLILPPPYVDYINRLGYFFEEYLLAYIFCRLEYVPESIIEEMLNHLNSEFVLSLLDLPYHIDDMEQLNDLEKILKKLPFRRIKNYRYEFVEAFLYE